MELSGARVLVTGGSKGIGASLARAYAAVGAKVVVAARESVELDAVAAEVDGAAVVADLTDAATVDALIPSVEADHGPIDVLVNNAGVETTDMAAVIDPSCIRAATRLNLEAPMVLVRHALPGMLARGRGHLVFLSSIAGTAGFPTMSTYCATKAGVSNYVRSLAMELKGVPVGTTTVAPGPVATRMWDAVEATSPSGQRVLKRMNAARMLPLADPDRLARRVVVSTARGRRHVRTPRRLLGSFLLAEAAHGLNETLLAGVRLDPSDTRPG
ncbi:MAG: SDR family NAD(P)-dependent oxidoreductase [Actinomycetota bacterium]|jgi:short-subunit dehydrogenase|nr:SDR family NAD(P)-dependent oxidoreductase [Actinomycetota bacterium]MED6327389.1 SDR family NAD(P)-dependent oxidoreductase [Actinomycetota bacterium]MEE2957686.1 SDR family NAD(P)-dependent oxidoreductase [Actinomycetota bacterium]